MWETKSLPFNLFYRLMPLCYRSIGALEMLNPRGKYKWSEVNGRIKLSFHYQCQVERKDIWRSLTDLWGIQVCKILNGCLSFSLISLVHCAISFHGQIFSHYRQHKSKIWKAPALSPKEKLTGTILFYGKEAFPNSRSVSLSSLFCCTREVILNSCRHYTMCCRFLRLEM